MSIFSTKETASQKLDALCQGLLAQQHLSEKIQQATKESFVRDTDDAWHELIRILLRNLEIVENTLPKPFIEECLTSLKIAQDSARGDDEVQCTQQEMMLPAPASGTSARSRPSGRGCGRKPRNNKRSSQQQQKTASATPAAHGVRMTIDEGRRTRGKSSKCSRKRKATSQESSSTAHVEMSAEQDQHNRTLSGRRVKRPARYSSA